MARKKRKRPHHTGSYQYRDGRHVVQWSESGRRRTRTLATAEEVAPFLARACGGLEGPRAYAGKLADLAQIWLDGRKEMASNYDDRNRWKNHLAPLLGFLTPDQVDVPVLKKVIQELRGKGLSKGTVGLCVALVSSLYGDLVEDGVAKLNPVRMLSRKTRRNELTSDRDPKRTPWLRSTEDVPRVYRALDPYVARAFIVGALAGLRTNEVRALRWSDVDLERRLIHVQVQASRRGSGTQDLKDGDSRFVPVSDALHAILSSAGRYGDLVCPPRHGSEFLELHLMGRELRQALARLELPQMRWYEATRHTFASQWVASGGSLETLQQMMGHSSVTTTERYAHLVPGLYSDADRARVAVEVPPAAERFVN